jgi:hypothetical protein
MGFHFGQKGQLSWSLSPYSFHLPSNMGKGVGVEGLSKTEVSTKWYSGNVLQEWDTVSLLTVPWEYGDSWGCVSEQYWDGVGAGVIRVAKTQALTITYCAPS